MSVARLIPITPRGLQRLEAEIRGLVMRRSEMAELLRQAKSSGDPAENAEYEDAKIAQAMLEARIAELRSRLGEATVIDPDQIPTDAVGVGCVVKVRELENDDEWQLTLVGPLEADPEQDHISSECPLGEVLLGRKPGEVVELRVPDGAFRYEVLAIDRADAQLLWDHAAARP